MGHWKGSLLIAVVYVSVTAHAVPGLAFSSLHLRVTPKQFGLHTTRCLLANKLDIPRHGRTVSKMSEIPWESPARPDNDVGYSPSEVPIWSLAMESRAETKFLGDVPKQRVFAMAQIESPKHGDAEADTKHKAPTYQTPHEAVDETAESLRLRSSLHKMMHQDVIDMYTGKYDEMTGGAKLHIRIGNANGCVRRWPKEQYIVTLFQVGNNEFELTPEVPQETVSAMGIVNLHAQYISSQRLFKISGYMDGADIEAELRAVNILSRSDQKVS